MTRVALANDGRSIVKDNSRLNLMLMALFSLSTYICKDPKIRFLIQKKAYRHWAANNELVYCDLSMWKEIKAHVEESFLKNLELPPILNIKLLLVLRLVITQMMKWFENHKEILKEDLIFTFREGFDIMKHMVWTPHGTINKYETALSILNNNRIHIADKYFLACHYCLEDIQEDLRRRMSPDERQVILFLATSSNPMICYLVHNDYGQIFDTLTWAYYKNSRALNYFFEKLDRGTREGFLEVVLRIFPFRTNIIDFTPFKENDRNFAAAMIRKNPSDLLMFFLDWPHQSNFYQAASQVISFMTNKNFLALFTYIINHKISQEFEDFDYKNVLIYLWSNCSEDSKNYIRKQWIYPKLRYTLEKNNAKKELFLKDKVKNFIHITSCWSKYIWNNYRMYVLTIVSTAVALYWM